MDLKQKLLTSNIKLCTAITGGGTGFITDLIAGGGMSDVLLDAQIPYSREATSLYVGKEIKENFNSFELAQLMAIAAFSKAQQLIGNKDFRCVGLGVTASLAYTNQREDRENSIHVVLHDGTRTESIKFELNNKDNRSGQEQISSQFIYDALEEFLSPFLAEIERHNQECGATTAFSDVYKLKDPDYIIYPGSFNPPHEGHKEVVDVVKEIVKEIYPGAFFFGEVTTQHNHKSNHTGDIVTQAKEASSYLGIPVMITNVANMEDKIKQLESFQYGIGFFHIIMGYDVYEKVVETPSTLDFLVKNFNVVKLLVFPRNGLRITASQVRRHPFLSHLCLDERVQGVRIDKSSTSIRNASTERQS